MTTYIGRFAPSPTGPLHMGSLVTALASWADARHHQGQWLLRIEDIDPPREIAGASDQIIAALQVHGLHWDNDITYQSRRADGYQQALATLRDKSLLYACQCTRKQLRLQATQSGSGAYPGHCSHLSLSEDQRPLRLRVNDEMVSFTDLHAGACEENVSLSVGDFIIRRKDNLTAYQLAVVVDDSLQGITHVVRGADLLDNTPRQIALQRALGVHTPAYLHLPLVLTDDGSKLSKQTGAAPLDHQHPLHNLQRAWEILGQPSLAAAQQVSDFLVQATARWQRRLIP
ncbi:MAG: tRNA glutamyl-Q(34) synthetase GluQRS [Pseudomonadota bacterium]